VVKTLTPAWTFIPTEYAKKLTTDIKLGASGTVFNGVVTWGGSTNPIFSSTTTGAAADGNLA